MLDRLDNTHSLIIPSLIKIMVHVYFPDIRSKKKSDTLNVEVSMCLPSKGIQKSKVRTLMASTLSKSSESLIETSFHLKKIIIIHHHNKFD